MMDKRVIEFMDSWAEAKNGAFQALEKFCFDFLNKIHEVNDENILLMNRIKENELQMREIWNESIKKDIEIENLKIENDKIVEVLEKFCLKTSEITDDDIELSLKIIDRWHEKKGNKEDGDIKEILKDEGKLIDGSFGWFGVKKG